ncbi:hypothetical protein F0562_005754 [Nyssa sinensis]|uniref:Uncharacterized protein n=1 Tax=Nyssa sinensis TaxID=561372 RepID=A0A5J5AJ24_9ASTE|nr:hypothetical protein F0562_005754 [Nyssa sinensis]
MGETALSLAAAGGVTKVARSLVRKNHTLLTMQNVYGLIPVVVAAKFGHIEMVHFLYHMTAEEDLNPESNNHQGAKLLTTCIIAQIYDIALDLVQQYPDLAIAVYKDSDESPNKLSTLNTLATRHSAFPSGTWLNFWQHWIYSCMPIHSGRVTNFRRGIERPINQDNISQTSILSTIQTIMGSAETHGARYQAYIRYKAKTRSSP